MTGTILLFLVAVIGISISLSKAYTVCYNCVGAASVADCDKITRCGDQQECFEEKVINSLNTHYNSGCRSKTSCQAGQIRQNGTAGELIACSKCCDTDFCNLGLCGGGTPRNSLPCLSCSNPTIQVADCNRIEQCSEDEMCYAYNVLDAGTLEPRYQTGCRPKLQCQSLARAPHINNCFECCDTPMCNLYKCGKNWTAVMHSETTTSRTHAHTSLPTTTVSSLLPPHISGLITINLNANTILSCNSNEPGVTYTWLYQGSKSLPLGVSIIGGIHLAIIGAKSSNVGTFTCVINKNGHQAASKTNVTIISEKAHVTSVVASPNHPQTGHTVDIHCNATGYPYPSIYWSYTDTMGIPYIPSSTSFPDPTTVRIVNFQPSLHGGTWSCIAKNSLEKDQFISVMFAPIHPQTEPPCIAYRVLKNGVKPYKNPQTEHRLDIHYNATWCPYPPIYWSYTDMMGSVKCPNIAEPQEILIPENLDYLAIDNYNVTPGSVVNIGCLSKDSHTLTGAKTLTCLDTGEWNNPLPKCLPKSLNDNVHFTSQPTNGTGSAHNLDLERFPLIVGMSLLGFACVFITIVLVYLIYTNIQIRRRKKRAKYQSQLAMYNIQTKSPVENRAATRDQLNCWRACDTDTSYHVSSTSYHVPSSSDCMIENLGFALRRESWSGY